MNEARSQFLAGERPDAVALFLADSFVTDDRLDTVGDRVEDGVVIVVDGERGRGAFQAATGVEAMAFARTAMQREGSVDRDLTGGTCPDADGDGGHEAQFIFAFAEERQPEAGGLYAEGDVIHAYAQCECGTAYSDRWVVE